MLEVGLYIVFGLLSFALFLSFIRLIKGPTLPDRVVALELITAVTVGFILAYAVYHDETHFIDVGIVVALTAFLTAVGFARYLERRGARQDD